MSSTKYPFKRVVLKITGEALNGDGQVYSPTALDFLANEIRSIHKDVELVIVIGGGNLVRGSYLTKNFQTQSGVADHIGMTATIMNALMIEDFLQRKGMETRLMSSISAKQVAEDFLFKRAIRHLQKGRIVILAGGTGNSGVTTDTAAVMRASDLSADIILKGTKVDGVYDKDPVQYSDAIFFPKLKCHDFLTKGISGILDRTAITQAETKLKKILVFNLFKEGNLRRIIEGEEIGTLIHP